MTTTFKKTNYKEIVLNKCKGIQAIISAPYCNINTNHKTDDEKVRIIKDVVCKYYGINLWVIESRRRKREIVEPRQIGTTLTMEFTSFSLKKTGLRFGGIDHSTVIYNRNTIFNLIDTDKEFKEKFNYIKNLIRTELMRK